MSPVRKLNMHKFKIDLSVEATCLRLNLEERLEGFLTG